MPNSVMLLLQYIHSLHSSLSPHHLTSPHISLPQLYHQGTELARTGCICNVHICNTAILIPNYSSLPPYPYRHPTLHEVDPVTLYFPTVTPSQFQHYDTDIAKLSTNVWYTGYIQQEICTNFHLLYSSSLPSCHPILPHTTELLRLVVSPSSYPSDPKTPCTPHI